MITESEKRFITYWEANRVKEKNSVRQLFVGIPIGMLFAIPILVVLFSGKHWYKRADAVAQTKFSPLVLIIAVILIVAFMAMFYKRYQWDQHEQQYLEFKAKEKKESLTSDEMQR